ncbi:Ima1 N-terminal domain-containing protein [Crucibulum laeve]|uniref:Ima1 N-terminal domain-containing protein n=1 Tax=Crucibulum laeve TaxID=68775 RepID=A0A5C3LYB9_9AGAR|nr:Ima1 N-terminal domain-containing protein [Crucibulum laeve]
MSALFRRQSNIQCFFCNSPVPIPKNPRNFRCSSCGCWNRYNDKGEILSDEPAMHDAHLNSKAFAKRASPSKDQIPTMYGPGPFCHTCQTNQMLLVNLMSNYLPAQEDPEYERRLAMLPEYRESLHARYPPVCESCLPGVEEEIQKKDHMARTKALGGWLQQSKGKERQRRVSGTPKERDNITVELGLWKMRGCLWLFSLVMTVMGYTAAALGYRPLRVLSFLQPVLPFLVFASLLWTVWDPTYASFRKSQIQGRDVRIKGKKQYIILQMIAWALRLTTSILIALNWRQTRKDNTPLHNQSRSQLYFTITTTIEIMIFATSCYILRLQHPPSIRLIDTNAHKFLPSRSATPNPASRSGTPTTATFAAATEPDLLAALSLSSKPVIAHPNPIFGHPSLRSSAPPSISAAQEERDNDEMDWTPTNADGRSPLKGKQKSNDDASWLRPQRFFAPEKPTGLEGLFERTRLEDNAMTVDGTEVPHHVWNWWWVYALSLVPLGGIAYKAWRNTT